ncbi:MAG: ADP-heptose synthase protein [Pseudomonadota bacterium]|jgi:rfaE bifunctional protein kinase chain/domain
MKFDSARVLICGDVMLDRYWFGDVDRISPEAPVPVVRVRKVEDRLGGAANVARNVAALGAQAMLYSVVGEDEAGRALDGLCRAQQLSPHLLSQAGLQTTLKLRVMGRGQQLMRNDFEDIPTEQVLMRLQETFAQGLMNTDVVVFSDYAKGTLAQIPSLVRLAKEQQKKILVDPKGNDFSPYRGADVLTPNRSELKQVVGAWADEADLAQKIANLCMQESIAALLLTRSEEGMSLFTPKGVQHFAAQAREVFDVTGAGDTVIAALATALASGHSLEQAVPLANAAAGVVVAKLGTSVCTFDELQHALAGQR